MSGVIIPDARGGLVWLHGTNDAGNPVKLGLLFGYDSIYAEGGVDLNAPAGTVTKTLSTVPAGEIWVVNSIAALNDTTYREIILEVFIAGVQHLLVRRLEQQYDKTIFWRGPTVLPAGGYVRIRFLGTVAGEDLYWSALGYKMKVV